MYLRESVLEVCATDLDRLALRTLMGGRVECLGRVPGVAAILLHLPLILLHAAFVDHAGDVQEISAHGAPACIDVSDEDDVQMLLDWAKTGTRRWQANVCRECDVLLP